VQNQLSFISYITRFNVLHKFVHCTATDGWLINVHTVLKLRQKFTNSTCSTDKQFSNVLAHTVLVVNTFDYYAAQHEDNNRLLMNKLRKQCNKAKTVENLSNEALHTFIY